MINPMNLIDKHILITGASQGIGKETAILASKSGAKISLIARSKEKLKETLSVLDGVGHNMFSFDLSEIKGIESLVKDVVQKNGTIHGLVHCAGIAPMRPIAFTSFDFVNEVMTINFNAFVELIRCSSKKNNYTEGASFIGISSVESRVGDKSKTTYCASKAAMDAATRCLAKELSTKKIRVNTIIAGLIKTDMLKKYIENAGENSVENNVLDKQYMGLGEPIDIANAAVFLLSDASKFITGTGLVVDGGFLS